MLTETVITISPHPQLQESPDDMPPGQTPHTVILYAHGDLVDSVQPGDRVAVTGIYRAVPLKANPRARNLKAVYKVSKMFLSRL